MTETYREATANAARLPLSKRRVLRAALGVIDREGLDALSMRRLGAELGVDPMAVYRHVDGKEAVLDGVAELLWEELPASEEVAGDWRDGLRAFARSLRALFHSHPHAVPLLVQRPVMPKAALEKSYTHMEALRRAGFDKQRTVEIARALISFSNGFGLAELSCLGVLGIEEWRQQSEREMLLSVAQALPPGIPPHLADVAIALWAECNPDVCFESGLELIIKGAQASLEEPSSPAEE